MRTYRQALVDVHRPQSVEDARGARNRLVYEELFELCALNAAHKLHRSTETPGYAHQIDPDLLERVESLFGFEATDDQRSAWTDIAVDLASEHPMSRLLLGDVGTGKTFVAVAALRAVADGHTQAAVMAPTEVLAKQYASKIGPLLDKESIGWVLLTSSLSSRARDEALAAIAAGDATVAFGTHALIQPDVTFKNLTLAIVDEQHRFGVEQRALLRAKATRSPDMLSMTATPIPRSLALTVFGDLSISTLRERPIVGAGVTTFLRTLRRVDDAHASVKEALDAGQQAYIVCALIEESSKLEVNAAVDLAHSLASSYYRDYRVGLLHGNMKSSEKDEVMEQFRAGMIDVLVSTTVVEVGVDIHNATRMVVYNAERFGLAQLHQLRGRVGRGAIPGQMWLVSDGRSTTARERFEALCRTDDGFELADIDLAMRGAGDIVGTRQSGAATMRIADLVGDLPIIELAQHDVDTLFEADPKLEMSEHQTLRKRLELLQEGYDTWVGAG
jgi:ATP-dependent DNA helicase RecG